MTFWKHYKIADLIDFDNRNFLQLNFFADSEGDHGQYFWAHIKQESIAFWGQFFFEIFTIVTFVYLRWKMSKNP